jgi:hypothetical protein
MRAAERSAALSTFQKGAIEMADEKPVVAPAQPAAKPAPAAVTPPRVEPATPAADPAYNPAQPATRQTPIDNPPSGKQDEPVKAIYHPPAGDPKTVEAFGTTLKAGEPVEVAPQFRNKVAGNPHFSIEGQKTFGDDQRKKEAPAPEAEDEGLSFDENVLANRMEEYGTSDPAAAEQMRQEGEVGFARTVAPRRRGRPPKDQVREEAKARAEEHDADLADARNEQSSDAERAGK